MNSGTVFTPNVGRTISRTGCQTAIATGLKSRAGSKSIFCGKCSATTIGDGEVNSSVYPSGGDFATCAAPSRWPAPGLFSMNSR